MIVYAALTYTAVVLGIIAAFGWLRAIKQRDEARYHARFFKRQRDDLRAAASRRGRHARGVQIAQQRARVMATAQRLEVGR